jgi:CelD/BcsL family acetyltransferase involved in cellulose biosynthesis
MNGRLTLITKESDLGPYVDAWRRWAPTPMQSPEWMLAWWSAFQTPATSLNVLIAHDDRGRPIGLAPLYLRESWAIGPSLRFLGSGKACSDFQALLSEPGYETQAADQVADWLIQAAEQRAWGLLELEGISENDPATRQLMARLQTYGCKLHHTDLESTWRLDLSGGWDGFLANLSTTQRRQTRNLLNRYGRNEKLTVQSATASGETHEALQRCVDLHQRRWHADGQPGCFADRRFRSFVEKAVDGLAARKQIQIINLEDQGIPIAALLFLRDPAGNLYMYQSGRDPQREKDNVGRVLNALAIRAACEAGVEYVDYLRGDEIYKARLGASPARCLRVRVVAPAKLPRLRHGLWTLGREMKNRAQELRQRMKACSQEKNAQSLLDGNSQTET